MNSNAAFGELAGSGKRYACDGGTWPRWLWFCGGALVEWGWAYLPHQVSGATGRFAT
jgi:hypothetical protein